MNSKINISNKGTECIHQDTLIKYLRGELTGKEMNQVERHLAICPMCADELEGLSLMESPEDIQGIAERLNNKIDARVDAPQKRNFSIPYYSKIAATLLVLVSISTLVYYSIKRITPPLTISEHVALEEKVTSPKATEQQDITAIELQELEKTTIKQPDERRITSPPAKDNIETINIADDVVDVDLSIDEIDEDTINEDICEIAASPLPASASVIDETSIGASSNERASEVAVTSLGRNKRKTKAETTSTSAYEPDSEVVELNLMIDEEDIDEEQVFLLVEKMPTFSNGENEEPFRTYVERNLIYPQSAAENGIQGKVFVEFTIEIDGTVSDVRVIKGVDPLLDKEAVRVIESSPSWNPGMQRGKPVRVKMNFPVNFIIE
jgi:protein TonB